MNNSLMAARFTVAYGCVLIAALLPIVCAAIAKWGQFNKPRREGGYDNGDPRAWLARQTLLGAPGNLQSVTGARGARVLGAIYPA